MQPFVNTGGPSIRTWWRTPVETSPAAIAVTAIIGWWVGSGAVATDTSLLVRLSAVGLVSVILVGSVLLHEAAHAFAAVLRGVRPGVIRLVPAGGHVTLGRLTPRDDVLISLAGPLSNLLLSAALAMVLQLAPLLAAELAAILWFALWLNLLLGLVNLLPALPLDGGHALAALTVLLTGEERSGRLVVSISGATIGAVVCIWGLDLLHADLIIGTVVACVGLSLLLRGLTALPAPARPHPAGSAPVD